MSNSDTNTTALHRKNVSCSSCQAAGEELTVVRKKVTATKDNHVGITWWDWKYCSLNLHEHLEILCLRQMLSVQFREAFNMVLSLSAHMIRSQAVFYCRRQNKNWRIDWMMFLTNEREKETGISVKKAHPFFFNRHVSPRCLICQMECPNMPGFHVARLMCQLGDIITTGSR